MIYSYKELQAMPTYRLRILQFGYFCLTKETPMVSNQVYAMLLSIVDILRQRKQRIFGPECLLNTNSDPRWKLADNRRRISNALD